MVIKMLLLIIIPLVFVVADITSFLKGDSTTLYHFTTRSHLVVKGKIIKSFKSDSDDEYSYFKNDYGKITKTKICQKASLKL